MIDTSFVETIDTSLFNTIVLVDDSENSHFVNEKLKMLISENDTNLPSDIEKLTSDLSYNNINRFQVILNNRLKEIIIAGAGKKEANNRSSFEKLGGYIYDAIRNKDTTVAVLNSLESSSYENVSSYIASGLILKSWTFNKYKTKQTNQKIKSIVCKTNYKEINERSFDHLKTLIEGVFDVRRMVSEPSNFMDPAQLCEEAMSLKKFGVKVTVIDKKQMEKLDMNALLGVAKGSDNPAYVVAMEYFEGGKSDDTVALVGKGLTFDSGGLCLKPSKGMGDMKGDMTGAALDIGTLKTLALQKAKTNVVGVIGIVENMISGSAQKPGDIVTSMSGKTFCGIRQKSTLQK